MTTQHAQPRAPALWSGRFDGKAEEPLFRAINDSLSVDWRLVHEDIAGSIAWVRALARAGVLERAEADALSIALGSLADEAAAMPAAPVESGAEDVHTWVELKLTERLGPLGKKLHTGRSRNDQVATDLRLWLKAAIDGLVARAGQLQGQLVEQAERHPATVFPGYTHLQRAQPVTFGHWCLAYVEMFERDIGRLHDARERANECPLGCGALAGTAYPIDREELAHDLGFARPSGNSLDAVSDRDAVVEVLAGLALLGVHLSRMAEDLVCYASGEFALVSFDDGVCSGSSLMPQKRNPDAAELLRGKAGRLIGANVAMLTTLKGLPLSYNKDLQEDKALLFTAVDDATLMLRVAARVIEGLRVNPGAALAAARGGHANATDVADALVAAGVPFREAHEQTAALVRMALGRGVGIEALDPPTLAEHAPALTPAALAGITLERGLAARAALGGTAPDRVEEAVTRWRARLMGRGVSR